MVLLSTITITLMVSGWSTKFTNLKSNNNGNKEILYRNGVGSQGSNE